MTMPARMARVAMVVDALIKFKVSIGGRSVN